MRLQTKDAARLLNMESWQIQSYAKQGFVESCTNTRGAGSRRRYDEIGLFKLAVLHQLTSDGFDIRTIREIFSGLFDFPTDSSMTPRQMIRQMFAEKTLITARQFSIRKLVRSDRTEQVVTDLLKDHSGLYVIDMNAIVESIFSEADQP
jgi:DNA-binding transcriptional MerR regulator